jgi:hypothetical protein
VSVIDSHALREQDNCTFGGSISCAVPSADNSKRGSYVNDRTAADFSHVRQCGPRELPNGTNVHIEGVVPLFFGYLLGVSNMQDPGVVQQKVSVRQSG